MRACMQWMKWVRRACYTPLRAASLKEFAAVAGERGCTRVIVRLMRDVVRQKEGSVTVPHHLIFKTETPQGRRMRCQELCFITPAFGNKKEREEAVIKLYLMAVREMQWLRAQLPNAAIVLIGHDGKPVDANFMMRLKASAEKHGIRIVS